MERGTYCVNQAKFRVALKYDNRHVVIVDEAFTSNICGQCGAFFAAGWTTFNVSSKFSLMANQIVAFDSLQKSPFLIRNVEKCAILMQANKQRTSTG